MRVGDLAARTGLTVRTLHHYDSLGLVVPSARTPAGHREYDDADVRRLYRVVALRRLGLALGDIAAVLSDEADPRALLRRQLAETDRRIEAERDVRDRLEALLAQLDRGAEPTTDDLLRAVEAMTMVERYYTPEQLETLARRREELGPEGMAKAQQDWVDVYADLDALREEGVDPADPRAQAVGARARSLIQQFTGGDPEMYASLKRLYDTEGAEQASRGMVTPERAAYLEAVMQAGRSDG
ncbi:MAG TPA: MerR family transcriptional regulator [Mycobacteriales bacterium]|jgi:DNA-binding transcriptional MerR regulator